MLCTISKENKTTFYTIYVMVDEGQYRCLKVRARKGKVIVDHKWSTVAALPGGLTEAPQFIAEHEVVRERVTNLLMEMANEAISSDVEQEIILSEKCDTWTVTAKLAECWLEWGLGKGFWSIQDHYPPHWAIELRGMWDHAWAR